MEILDMNLDLPLQVLFMTVPVGTPDGVVCIIENPRVFFFLMPVSVYSNIQLQYKYMLFLLIAF